VRLLVLDGSLVLRHVVARLVPSDVAVESAATFDEAWRVLTQRPPDALIVTLGPSDLPWRRIQRRCHESDPPIPVLFESCVHPTPEEAGLDAIDGLSSFLGKPYPASQLRSEIDRLLRLAETRALAPKA
jgi:DNA-binding response OmpR family regulator